MAADEDKTTIEVPEGDQADKETKKGKSKIMLFAIIGVVCIGIGIGGAMFLGKSSSGDSEVEAEESHQSEEKEDSHAKKPAKKKKKSSGHGEQGSVVIAIKDIVVNPAGTGGSRFLSVSFGFELESAELAAEFEEREPLVRDALITILSSKTVSQLTDIKQKEIMRYQVKKRLSRLLKTKGLENVYFTDFVLQ